MPEPSRWMLDVKVLAFILLLSGCRTHKGPQTQSSRPDDLPRALPSDARLITRLTGRGAFVAEENGTLYILDSHDHLVFSTDMRLLQRLLFYPEQNIIYFDGRPVDHEPLKVDHLYRFYFSKGS